MSFLRSTRGASSSLAKRATPATFAPAVSVSAGPSKNTSGVSTSRSHSTARAMSPPSSRSAQVARHLAPQRTFATSSSKNAQMLGNSQIADPSQAIAAPGLPEPHTGGGVLKDEPKVLLRNNNTAVEIILNRHAAINALDLDMVRGISGAIQKSSHSKYASCIILRASEGARGLCSGGDVLQVVNMAKDSHLPTRKRALNFFKEEFELDWRIAKLGEEVISESNTSARPMVALMDGITMGGGVGLSVHAPFRVATEKTRFAMPETGIGYFPDVGVTRVLSRLDGRIGAYLGMTGDHISGEEAYLAGLATHFVASSSLPALTEALAALPVGATAQTVATCIDDFSTSPLDVDSGLNPKSAQIAAETPITGDKRVVLDYVFAQPSVAAVFAALEDLIKATNEEANGTQAGRELREALGLPTVTDEIRDWASKTYRTLELKSPRSLKIAHQAINYEARRFDVDESFRFDMRMATVFCDLEVGEDFYNGVHHVLTKDPQTGSRRTGRAPWKPSTIEEVDDTLLRDLFFASLEDAQNRGLKLTPPHLDIPERVLDRAAMKARDRQLRGVGPLGWEPHFNAYHSLPSEAELEALLQGSHPSAGSLAIDLADASSIKEIADVLRSSRGGRRGQALGLEKKVADWRQRRLRAAGKQ